MVIIGNLHTTDIINKFLLSLRNEQKSCLLICLFVYLRIKNNYEPLSVYGGGGGDSEVFVPVNEWQATWQQSLIVITTNNNKHHVVKKKQNVLRIIKQKRWLKTKKISIKL